MLSVLVLLSICQAADLAAWLKRSDIFSLKYKDRPIDVHPEDVEVFANLDQFMKQQNRLHFGVDKNESIVLDLDAKVAEPVHGYYCGPGTPNSENREPQDLTDAVCQAHDRCWARNFDLHCGCDRIAIRDFAGAAVAPGNSARGRAVAALAYSWFSVAPCICKSEICVPYPCCSIRRGCRTCYACNTITTPGVGGNGAC